VTDPLVPAGVRVHRDVVHTKLEGYRPLSLDLYLPDAGATAVCVYVHGGGWRVGSRRSGPGPMSPSSSRWLARMAQDGLAVAAVDYRFSGEARFPAQLHDVAAAVRWLRDDSRFGLGHLPFTVFGASAGGLLAALAALDPSLQIRAAALWYAVSHIATMPEDQAAVGGPLDPPGESREELLIGGLVADLPEVARAASPVHQVRAEAPPFFLLHGGDDILVPVRQSERLHATLLAAGASSTLEKVEGYGHMLAGIPDSELEALVDRTAAFLLAERSSP